MEIAEHLAGHRGYLTDSYRRYTDAELIENYKKAEPQLTVQAPAEIREIQSEFWNKMQAHSEILENPVVEEHRAEETDTEHRGPAGPDGPDLDVGRQAWDG